MSLLFCKVLPFDLGVVSPVDETKDFFTLLSRECNLFFFVFRFSLVLSLSRTPLCFPSRSAQVDALTDDSILLFGRVPSAAVAANSVPPTLLLADNTAGDSDPIPAQLAFGPSGIETFLARLQYLNLHGQALRYGAAPVRRVNTSSHRRRQ